MLWMSVSTGVFGENAEQWVPTQTQPLELTLSQAVRMALSRNIELLNERLDQDLSESVFRSGLAPYHPRLQIGADSETVKFDAEDGTDESTQDYHVSSELSKQFASTGGSVAVYSQLTRHDDQDWDPSLLMQQASGYYSNTLGLRLDQPLLRNVGPWSDWIRVRQNHLLRENDRISYQLAVNQTRLDVISMFFSAIKQEKLVNVAARSVADAQMHLQNTRIKLEEGLVAQMDVSQAELQLARQQTTLIRMQQSAAAQLDALKIMLNLPLATPVTLLDPPEQPPESMDPDLAVREALDNRLELVELANSIRSAEMSVSAAANQRLPDLDLTIQAESVHRYVPFEESFDTGPDTWNLSMGFSYTFGEKLQREEWLQARIQLVKLRNRMDSRRQAIEKEIRDEVRSYQALMETLSVSAKAKDIAEKNLELANRSYQEGLTGNLDLIKAQDDLIAAGNAYYSDMLDLAVAKARIIHALGREIDSDHLELNGERGGY